jgi:hypothetical protein
MVVGEEEVGRDLCYFRGNERADTKGAGDGQFHGPGEPLLVLTEVRENELWLSL